MRRLPDAHASQLYFLEVRVDPQVVERNDRHHRRARLDALTDLDRALGDIACDRRVNRRALHRQKGVL